MLTLEQEIPQYLRVAPGLYYAGIRDGVPQFTPELEKAIRIVPARIREVALFCRSLGYGKKASVQAA